MKKRILSLLLTFSLLAPGVLTFPVRAAAATSGSCGNNLTWSYDVQSRTLTISGSGDMTDYYDIGYVPWYTYRSAIETLDLPEGMTSIGNYAFYGESRLTSVDIPNTVTRIGKSAFSYCTSLDTAPLPAGLTFIGSNAFHNCALTTVDIPAGVTTLPSSVFGMNDSLTSVTIPGTVTTVENWAFVDCSGLKSATVEEGVTTIGEFVFDECDALTSLNIPASVTSLGKICERPNDQLVVRVDPDNQTYCIDENGLLLSKDRTKLFEYPGNKASGVLRVPEGVTTIARSAFSEAERLTQVILPNSMTTIEAIAFGDCPNLSDINLPDSITAIGDSAFWRCISLSKVDLPESLTKVEARTFYGCTALEYVDIPIGITSIGDYAFYQCSALQYIPIPDGVQTIGSFAFNSSGLLKITLPESVTSLGEQAFSSSYLKEVTLSKGLKSIPYRAFYGASYLNTITFPYTLKTIGSQVFTGTALSKGNVFFIGTEEQRAGITLGADNTALTNANWTYIAPIEPTSVSIRGENRLAVGGTATFTATVLPRDAFDRSVSWKSSNVAVAKVNSAGVVTGVGAGMTTITATTCNGKTASITVQVKGEGLTITVNGYSKEDILADPNHYQPQPLAGATVTLDATTKKTDKNGQVSFAEAELSKSAVSKIIVSYDNTYEVKESYIYYSTKRDHTYNLARRSGEIKFQAISATLDGAEKDLLATRARKYVSYFNEEGTELNKTATCLSVTVDWGRYQNGEENRKIWLSGEDGQTVVLEKGKNHVVLTDHFDAGEDITLTATTLDENGNEVRVQKLLPLGLKVINASLNVQPTEEVSLSALSYLKDLSTEIEFENLFHHASKVGVENGVLTVEFGKKDKESLAKEVELFKGFLTGKAGPEVALMGRAQIPIKQMGGNTWSGGVKVYMGDSVDLGDTEVLPMKKFDLANLFDTTYNFNVSGIPLYVESTLKAGLEGELFFGGTMEKSGVSGTLNPKGSFSLGGGVGAGYDTSADELEVKFGFDGELEVNLPATYSITPVAPFKTDAAFDPEIKGTVSAKLDIKVMAVDLEGKIELGHVLWNKNGATWWDLGEEGALFSLDDAVWQVGNRDYLENGGGFVGGDPLALFSEEEQSLEQILYANVSPYSEGDIAIVKGAPMLLFSVDDTTRTAANGLKAVYSRCEEGTWFEPVAIDDDGTLDTGVTAYGKFVAWENSNVKFEDDVTLDEMLKATDIQVAVWNGETETYDVTSFPSAADYEFGVKIAQYKDAERGIAAWLSNSEGDITGQTGVNSLHYSVYENAWSDVVTVENIGVVTNLEVYHNGSNGFVFYKNAEGTRYLLNASRATNKPNAYNYFEGMGRYDYNGDLAAYLDKDKVLRVTSGRTEKAAVQTAYQGTENPVLVSSDYGDYVFWSDKDGLCYATNASGAWSGKLCLDNSDAAFSSVSAVVTGEGSCLVSYYRTKDGTTDLVTRTVSFTPDLSLDYIVYDQETYGESGNVKYAVSVTNCGAVAAEDVSVSFYEDNTCIYSDTVYRPIASGEQYVHTGVFHPLDGTTGHTYNVVISAPGSTADEKKKGELLVGVTDLSVSQAWFGEDDFGGKLSVFVENTGDLDVENSIVQVYQDSIQSEPIASVDSGKVLAGHTVQIDLNEEQDRSAVYYVTVTAEGDVLPHNNMTMLAYDNAENLNIDVSASCSGSKVTVNLSKNESPIAKVMMVCVAYTSYGKMKQVQTETIDLSVTPTIQRTKQFDKLSAGDTVSVLLIDPETYIPLQNKYFITVT